MEPSRFEQSLRSPERVVIRQQRTKVLHRLLEFTRFTIDDVVNDPRAKAAILRWYRIADACEWETCRTILAQRVAFQAWVRANR